MFGPSHTAHLYEKSECKSVVQKAIRRCDELLTGFFVAEMDASSHGNSMWSLLFTSIAEDISIAQPHLPVLVLHLYDRWNAIVTANKGKLGQSWRHEEARRLLETAAWHLCASSKLRITATACGVVFTLRHFGDVLDPALRGRADAGGSDAGSPLDGTLLRWPALTDQQQRFVTGACRSLGVRDAADVVARWSACPATESGAAGRPQQGEPQGPDPRPRQPKSLDHGRILTLLLRGLLSAGLDGEASGDEAEHLPDVAHSDGATPGAGQGGPTEECLLLLTQLALMIDTREKHALKAPAAAPRDVDHPASFIDAVVARVRRRFPAFCRDHFRHWSKDKKKCHQRAINVLWATLLYSLDQDETRAAPQGERKLSAGPEATEEERDALRVLLLSLLEVSVREQGSLRLNAFFALFAVLRRRRLDLAAVVRVLRAVERKGDLGSSFGSDADSPAGNLLPLPRFLRVTEGFYRGVDLRQAAGEHEGEQKTGAEGDALLRHRLFAMPEWAVDKHTFRGKGIDTRPLLVKYAAKQHIDISHWDETEIAKSHGPGVAFAGAAAETPGSDREPGNGPKGKSKSKDKGKASPDHGDSSGTSGAGSTSASAISEFFDEGATVVGASKRFANIYHERCRRFYLQEERLHGYRQARSKYMEPRVFPVWLRHWGLGAAAAALAQADAASSVEPEPWDADQSEATDAPELVDHTPPAASRKRKTRSQEERTSPQLPSKKAKSSQLPLASASSTSTSTSSSSSSSSTPSCPPVRTPSARQAQPETAGEEGRDHDEEADAPDQFKTTREALEALLSRRLSSAERASMRDAVLGQQPTSRHKKVVRFLSSRVVCKGPYRLHADSDVATLLLVAFRSHVMKQLWGDDSVLEPTLVWDYGEPSAPGQPAGTEGDEPGTHEPLADDADVEATDEQPAEAHTAAEAAGDAGTEQLGGARVAYVLTENVATTPPSQWQWRWVTMKARDGQRARIVERASMGIRNVTHMLDACCAGGNGGSQPSDAAMLTVFRHLVCRFVIDPIVGDTHLANMLHNDSGRVVGIDIEERRTFRVPSAPSGAAFPALMAALFSKAPKASLVPLLRARLLRVRSALLQCVGRIVGTLPRVAELASRRYLVGSFAACSVDDMMARARYVESLLGRME